MCEILCSTGALIGKPNNRDYRLLGPLSKQLSCDGFEFMMYSSWYDEAEALVEALREMKLHIPIMHCEKHIGEAVSKGEFDEAYRRFDINCRIAAKIGAGRMVVHLWDGITSDAHFENNIVAYARLREIAAKYQLELLVENVVCNGEDPMERWCELREKYPDIRFVFDTKMAAFHQQLDLLYGEEYQWLWKEGHICHYHVNDYAGGYKEWAKLRTLPVGRGHVDFQQFFEFIRKSAYQGTFTVEATAFGEDGSVDVEMLNEQFRFIREAAKGVAGNRDLWQKYPRPQMRRGKFILLNGEWELDGDKITVPFPPQSGLSGYEKPVGEKLVYRRKFTLSQDYSQGRVLLHFGAVDQVCEVYLNGEKLQVCAEKGREDDRNPREHNYTHEGGYLPFTLDITGALRWTEEEKPLENILEVRVTDTLSEKYPYGKQCKNRGGMWYTPVSGIWQSVWLEAVPTEYIKKLMLTPDLEGVTVRLETNCGDAAYGLQAVAAGMEEKSDLQASAEAESTLGPQAGRMSRHPIPMVWGVTITLENGEEIREIFTDKEGRIDLSAHVCEDGTPYRPILWTPQNPHLYPMKILYGGDCVETYFALRTIEIREISGVNRVCLNGEPVFLHGVLDQGYFPEGIYLPKAEEEYERDILRMKALGYNMLRKHIKVEPECFYYYCDLHGMLVMQDMVNNGHYSYLPLTVLPTIGLKKRGDKGGLFCRERMESRREMQRLCREKTGAESRREMQRECREETGAESTESEARKRIFREHTRGTIDHLYNHPCIIAYTIFNEGWGQFDSDNLYDAVKEQDPTRLVDSTSGWFAQERNDFDSEHIYFRAKTLKPGRRPMLLSECGGFSLAVEGHRFHTEKSYGYGACKSKEDLTERILEMYRKMVLPAIGKGLCGCVYTQLSDVEDEINGLYTYDREVCKVVEEQLVKLAEEIQEEIRKFSSKK